MSKKVPAQRAPKHSPPEPWPDGQTETVPNCPVCGNSERDLLHSDLWDRVFFSAPGLWNSWRCRQCESAYLDPRPTEDSIGLAYRRYYTHDEQSSAPRAPSFRMKFGNGYRSERYGASVTPASRLGKYIGRIPPIGWGIDNQYRYLPRHRGRVLDIGAGGGDWLELARSSGWQVASVEPDPVARERSQKNGIEARSSPEDWLASGDQIDAFTINHAIEHVPDPQAPLNAAFRLLKSGGQLFVETPNIDALGHRIFGRDWVALDPPRHLVIFNRKSLHELVKSAGFHRIRFRHRPTPLPETFGQSERIAAGLDPLSPPDPAQAMAISLWKLRARLQPSRSEYLTLTAIKD